MKPKSKGEGIPGVVLSLLLVFVFLPIAEDIYYSFFFCPRFHGRGIWDIFKFEWDWGHWECLWAFLKTTPGMIFNGAWLLSLIGLIAIYNFPQLLTLGVKDQGNE